jgi:hypothetical protein
MRRLLLRAPWGSCRCPPRSTWPSWCVPAAQGLRGRGGATHTHRCGVACCVERFKRVLGPRCTRTSVISLLWLVGAPSDGAFPLRSLCASPPVQVCMDARILPASVLGLKEGCVALTARLSPQLPVGTLPRVPKRYPLSRNASPPTHTVPFFPPLCPQRRARHPQRWWARRRGCALAVHLPAAAGNH